MHYTALVTLLSLLLFFTLSLKVGRARGRFQIEPPATTGHPEFERTFRAHQNTLESMMLYLPALWLFAYYVSDRWAAALGLVWIVGRILYARGYYVEAKKRSTGFLVAFLANGVLILGALGRIAWTLAH
ncbi:MAG TPA: MAPEG family protein [Candidatus Binatia bacterium]|nr:MAPEG family protein [Candidatus Binatia bacterium]